MDRIGPEIDKTALRIKAVCLLSAVGKEPFDIIDRMLHLEPGEARRTYQAHTDAYRTWHKKFAQEALESFFQDQITVLEMLSKSAPAAIKLWTDMLMSDESKRPDRERAAKEIREWTKLFLASKDKAGVRDLIPDALLEAHDEAEQLGGHLQAMLGSSLGLGKPTS